MENRVGCGDTAVVDNNNINNNNNKNNNNVVNGCTDPEIMDRNDSQFGDMGLLRRNGESGKRGTSGGKFTDPSTIRAPSSLAELISELHAVFSDDEICVEYVQKLMASYKSNPQDWRKFAKFDKYKYTRNLVDEGNGKFNLMMLCWNEAQGSSIHSHADSHCFLKVLDGQVKEDIYFWPDESSTTTETATTTSSSSSSPSSCQVNEDDVNDTFTSGAMKKKDEKQFDKNECTYINDSVGLHRVENDSHINKAVTLHLYSPPFTECQCFDQRSGRATTAKMTFWSKFGKRTPFGRNPEKNQQPVEDN